MKKGVLLTVFFTIFFILKSDAQLTQYVTTADGNALFKQIQNPMRLSSQIDQTLPIDTIHIKEQIQFQSIEGFGFTLTGGSAGLLYRLPKEKRKAILYELFGQGPNALNVNYLRISMGASDLDAKVFSYDDLLEGEVDPKLEKMSIAVDQQVLIPLLKEIKSIQPDLKLIATPWSPPTWMKDNGKSMGGHLLPEYAASYAQYFVKYIQFMQAVGLKINAVTIQNEPEHGGNNPSMLMTSMEQLDFIKNHLGPAFKKNRIQTEIVIWDHNADNPNYPITILNDSIAKSYISASAFHLYLGNTAALSEVHAKHPDKKIYFTEQWTGAKGNFAGDFMWHMNHIVIGTMANWSSMVLEWNLANDSAFGPHTAGGCTECLGALTISGNEIQRNVSYFIIGQASKWIPRNAKRIATTVSNDAIKAIAFVKPVPDKRVKRTGLNVDSAQPKVLLVVNNGAKKQVCILDGSKKCLVALPENSSSTFNWE